MTSKDTIKINYVLVCDDLREEKDTKKFTILGLYSRQMILGSFPVVLPKLAFRICLGPVKVDAKMSLDVIRPDGKLIGNAQIKIESIDDPRGEAIVNLILSPFPVEIAGEYKLVITHEEKKFFAVAFEAVGRKSLK